MLEVLDLFSGIGGFSLGLERTGGFRTSAFCEIDPYARKVLAKHWPDVPIYEDVRTITKERLDADGIAVDVVCGGFPCQDISVAGKGRGLDGERSGLWLEFLRIIEECQPEYAIIENVRNLLSGPADNRGGWFATILEGLAKIGYDAQWEVISAREIGAIIERPRIWVITWPNEKHGGKGMGDIEIGANEIFPGGDRDGAISWIQTASERYRGDNGVRGRIYKDRVGACGNAIVPQIPQRIGEAILKNERERNDTT